MKIANKPSPNYDEKRHRKIKFIIIHYTGMATAKASIRRLRDKKSKVSCHYLINRKGHIIQMVNDLNLPIKVISHPIVREKSGLAMSSRNLRLSTNGKKIAPFIYRGLVEAKKEYKKNSKTTVKKIINNLKKYYAINNIKHIDYIEVINPRDISYPLIPRSGDYILTAIKIGKIRLIDNLKF